MASPGCGTSSRGRRLSPKEPDNAFVYPMSPRQNSGGMRDRRKGSRGTGEEDAPIEVLDSSLDQTPRQQQRQEGDSSDEDGSGGEGSGGSSRSSDEDGDDSGVLNPKKAAKRRKGESVGVRPQAHLGLATHNFSFFVVLNSTASNCCRIVASM